MTQTICDRCREPMPKSPESMSVVWRDGERVWRVTLLAPRERDLCMACRVLIVTNGEYLTPLTVEDVVNRPLPTGPVESGGVAGV